MFGVVAEAAKAFGSARLATTNNLGDFRYGWVGLVALLSLATPATAQFPTTVQLPSVRVFSYTGSVLVPDGGTASLGGVSRSSSFSRSRGFGPFRNRSAGYAASTSQLTASATIIDLAEMDEAILGQTPQQIREQARARLRPSDPQLMERGKRLVRLARRYLEQGNVPAARSAYLAALDRLSRINDPAHRDTVTRLHQYAAAEYRGHFGDPLMSRAASR